MPTLFYIERNFLLDVLSEICQAHITLAEEGVMHGEGGAETVVGVTTVLLGVLQIIAEHRLIVGMSHLNELLSLLHSALATQVGYTIFGDDSVHEMAGMVDMAGEWNDGTDGTTLGSGTAGEDAEVRVASEVGRTANTVHHLRAADLG